MDIDDVLTLYGAEDQLSELNLASKDDPTGTEPKPETN